MTEYALIIKKVSGISKLFISGTFALLENTATNEQFVTHIDTQECFLNAGIAQKIVTI